MDRGRIKIIEFGEEGDAEERHESSPAKAFDGIPMKVLEFDAAPSRPVHDAAAPSVRFIKIREFDVSPGEGTQRRSDDRPRALPARGAMKIVEFDAEPAGRAAEAPRRNGPKIVEFD